MTRKKWTSSEERRLLQLSRTSPSLKACFMAIAAETGRTESSVSNHYYKSMQSVALTDTPEPQTNPQRQRKWTSEEDAILSRYIDSSVTNLKACFLAVAEQTGRTPGAVANHWYTVLSKREMHFATISKSHIAKNRKNGEGIESNLTIWQRFVSLLSSLHL